MHGPIFLGEVGARSPWRWIQQGSENIEVHQSNSGLNSVDLAFDRSFDQVETMLTTLGTEPATLARIRSKCRRNPPHWGFCSVLGQLSTSAKLGQLESDLEHTCVNSVKFWAMPLPSLPK